MERGRTITTAAWETIVPDPYFHDYATAVCAQRFDAAGRPAGASFLVSNVPEVAEQHPVLSVNRGGAFAVGWHSLHMQ